ncbi:MAG: hypothetical protein H2B05_04520 [Nitrosopumilaceae archaeon]|jgi:hypothetical protein|uniref:Uncharacterized protein n=3 Tax=Candidatus Nitrosomaritimum aestuariumsis TaxID=3342354 RepID=A0AC60VWW8_9ARCH|nr:hypothetical protein [Nitrosopumilaceae archaeon]MBA4454190.1 hypothetical protein [Nitrosopumilaceae archaeon]MBA4459470.1 hypothetical protein [Nitrosopumilaceae archaeon]MBA4462488.1 hypothetical protein [Nitrosopumilaceae archaeon]MBA4463488.1 hypothetical protein [Nitrosopumilaceae archaeon]
MGLMYTKLYLDFEPEEWTQISANPTTFQSIKENVSLEIMDTSTNSCRLQFKKGAKVNLLRVVGKFRLTWEDADLVE